MARMARMVKNGYKWLKIARNGWDGLKWLEKTENCQIR